jgi:hypothetical protein
MNLKTIIRKLKGQWLLRCGVLLGRLLNRLGISLLLDCSKNGEEQKTREKTPNERVSPNVEIPRWGDRWRKSMPAANAVQNSIVGADTGKMYQDEANHCKDKSGPSPAQEPHGNWAFTYPNLDERNADRQNTRRQCGNVLGETVEGVHFLFECFGEDLRLVRSYLMRFWRHVVKRPNRSSAKPGFGLIREARSLLSCSCR